MYLFIYWSFIYFPLIIWPQYFFNPISLLPWSSLIERISNILCENFSSWDFFLLSRSETGSRTGGWSWRGRCRTPWLTPARPTSPLSWCITPSCRPTGRGPTPGITQQHRRARLQPPTPTHTACCTAPLCPASPLGPWTPFTSTTACRGSCCPLPQPNSWAPTRPTLSITDTLLESARWACAATLISTVIFLSDWDEMRLYWFYFLNI